MPRAVAKIAKEIRVLPDRQQLELVDVILSGLDRPDPRIDRIWAAEARKRWAAYKAGRVATVSHATIMARHRRT